MGDGLGGGDSPFVELVVICFIDVAAALVNESAFAFKIDDCFQRFGDGCFVDGKANP